MINALSNTEKKYLCNVVSLLKRHYIYFNLTMKNIIRCFIVFLISCLLACENGPQFTVEGTVSNAGGKMIYLEASGIEGVILLDSFKLKNAGVFNFSSKSPEAPEFYRLRVDDKVINFSVDSTETIKIMASYNDFPLNYAIQGSENSNKIKELTLLQIDLQKKIDALMKASEEKSISSGAFEDSLQLLVQMYKDTVKINYIFTAPNKAYAYYALFQEVNGYMLFDPFNSKDDIKCFAAVATSFNNLYPHADRSKNLYNMVIKGMKNTRTPKQMAVEVPQINESGIIDINLKDMRGNERKLSDLKGKVILLDFTAYQTAISVPHNFMLRELYDKYSNQGLEIYQISFDLDEHFWKTSADNLPWICVRDPNGVYSSTAAIYNVQKLPTYYLVNKNSELSARDENIKDLEEAIKRLL